MKINNAFNFSFHFSFPFAFIIISSFFLVSVMMTMTMATSFNLTELAWGHSLLGGSDAGLNGTQTQRNGNYVVELFLNPSQPLVEKNTDIFLRIVSDTGDELIELPVAIYIFKDGKPIYSNPENYTIVKQGHFNFNYVFDEPGQYLLFIDVKDIFYTLNVINFIFEIHVDLPLTDKIVELLRNYYFVYIPIIIIGVVIAVLKLNKSRGMKIKK